MDKASDFESEDCEFESRRGHYLYKTFVFWKPLNLRKPWRDIFTYYLSLITYYLLLITYYLLLITYYLSLITYYLLLIISFITPITAGNSKYTFPVTAVAVVVVVVVAVYL